METMVKGRNGKEMDINKYLSNLEPKVEGVVLAREISILTSYQESSKTLVSSVGWKRC